MALHRHYPRPTKPDGGILNNLHLVLGGPGCGKTTRLLGIVEAELGAGVDSKRIAFVSFTKRATMEAQERAALRFKLTREDDLPWFRTIHSMTFQKLGIMRDEVMGWKDWRDFSEYAGYPLSGNYEADGLSGGTDKVGDQMLRVIDFANATMTPLQQCWQELGCMFSWYQLAQFSDMLKSFKQEVGKIDFGDMLTQYVASGTPLDVIVAIIDEAQDLTALQWAVVRKAFANVERIYVAGDDDQAIYRWAGADIDEFMRLSTEPEVLPLSHRLPVSVHAFASGISQRISRRYTKLFDSAPRPGSVQYHMRPEGLDLHDGTWLLLARNNYMLPDIEAMVRSYGVNYATRKSNAVKPDEVVAMYMWEELRSGKRKTLLAKEARPLFEYVGMPRPLMKELQQYTPAELGLPIQRIWHEAFEEIPSERREFYISCLRRKEKLNAKPRIRIETIHGVKGGEADNVMLMTDISARTSLAMQVNADNEHRVFYVGATRARENLHIVAPQSGLSYTI